MTLLHTKRIRELSFDGSNVPYCLSQFITFLKKEAGLPLSTALLLSLRIVFQKRSLQPNRHVPELRVYSQENAFPGLLRGGAGNFLYAADIAKQELQVFGFILTINVHIDKCH